MRLSKNSRSVSPVSVVFSAWGKQNLRLTLEVLFFNKLVLGYLEFHGP